MTPKPADPRAIVTRALPTRCPACGHPDIEAREAFIHWRVACPACGWAERYQIGTPPWPTLER